MVLLEAMASGLPIVATRCFPDIEEIIGNGQAGLLVDVGDVNGVADAMERLLADSQLRDRMAKEGRRRAQRFSLDTIAAQYLAVLDGIERTPCAGSAEN